LNAPDRLFRIGQTTDRPFNRGDGLALVLLVVLLYVGVRLSFNAPQEIAGPEISLEPQALPWYAALSVGRMAAAYALSMIFTLVYGRIAAYNRSAERVMMPLLDVLQSVPILSFLPVVLLSFSAFLPDLLAAELASIILIFTSQVWNLTFAWYQSLTTIPKELSEASAIFRLNTWMKFKKLEFPFSAISLVWNSMMSWAGGWFFLMAAETFTVGQRDFRLPGLGSYLQEAANQSDFQAIAWGLTTLILTIVLLDQLVWRPLLAWSERFKIAMVADDEPATSRIYDSFRNSRINHWLTERVTHPVSENFDMRMISRHPDINEGHEQAGSRRWVLWALSGAVVLGLGYGLWQATQMMLDVSASEWGRLLLGTAATLMRVAAALMIALLWTIPLGVAIGTNQRLATLLQPVVQIFASVPATALFPIILLFMLQLPGGLNIASVLLMLLGTQWYLLFNIIAGASAIPQDLKYTARLMQLNGWQRWRSLILPALFPYIITGAITATGGAWNASIVAEHVVFAGETLQTTGIGAVIAESTNSGDFSLLLASTLLLVFTVVLINRFFWRRLYVLAEEKYRME
jgi:NitT/TauT family transport system permease protein